MKVMERERQTDRQSLSRDKDRERDREGETPQGGEEQVILARERQVGAR